MGICTLLATFLARRDYEAHHHPRKKKAVSYKYHVHEPSRRQKTPNQPPPTADLQIFITLHRSDLSHSKDWMEILWSKPPGESWCNGPLFWGSKRLVFWSGCIWIQLICDQVSPQCWLACGSLTFLLDAPLEGHWPWAEINIPTTLWASPFTTKTLFHFGRSSRS